MVNDIEDFMRIDKSGSPNRLIHRTFRAVFDLPTTQNDHNLIKIDKHQYRNPIYLAREWRQDLVEGKYSSQADLSRKIGVSRARVTQILNLLKLPGDIIKKVVVMGDPLSEPLVTERYLRQIKKNSVYTREVAWVCQK